jgi:hypothetical protein
LACPSRSGLRARRTVRTNFDRRVVPEAGSSSYALVSAGCRATSNDSGTFVRIELELGERTMAADLVHEAVPDIEGPPPPIERVIVESLVDLRASKITCLLSRVRAARLGEFAVSGEIRVFGGRRSRTRAAQRQRHRSRSARVAPARLRDRVASGDVSATIGPRASRIPRRLGTTAAATGNRLVSQFLRYAPRSDSRSCTH